MDISTQEIISLQGSDGGRPRTAMPSSGVNLGRHAHEQGGVPSRGKSTCKKFPHLGMTNNLCIEGAKRHISVVAEKSTLEGLKCPARKAPKGLSWGMTWWALRFSSITQAARQIGGRGLDGGGAT